MDQLPDLQSDADVDALMARIRARLATPASSSQAPAPERSGHALRDFLAAQEDYASAMYSTLRLLADTLEELDGATPRAPAPPTRAGTPAAPRASGRRRKTR